MLRLIEKNGDQDIYQFVDEDHEDSRKSEIVSVDWKDGKPRGNHPTTYVAYFVERHLLKIGRQELWETMD
jgi:hypothetical protein